jgi:hypothetical protein
VSRRAGKQGHALEVQVMYEPNRFAAECVAVADERLVPMARRAVAPGRDPTTAPQARRRSHAGGAQG